MIKRFGKKLTEKNNIPESIVSCHDCSNYDTQSTKCREIEYYICQGAARKNATREKSLESHSYSIMYVHYVCTYIAVYQSIR